jgi:hypothetical protein
MAEAPRTVDQLDPIGRARGCISGCFATDVGGGSAGTISASILGRRSLDRTRVELVASGNRSRFCRRGPLTLPTQVGAVGEVSGMRDDLAVSPGVPER